MISIILGRRPEIIKMSPIIRECEKKGINYFLLHTGQHYSKNMDAVFFDELDIPEPEYNLSIGSAPPGEQTGKMLIGIEKILSENNPDVVLVQGDTNTVLAGAIAATKMNIALGHIEAGLRSYDRRMPEEINRVLTDHCSNFLFAPTQKSQEILLGEGISENLIYVTGNTVVDAVHQNLKIGADKVHPLEKFGLQSGKYCLATVHRQESVDQMEIFWGLINGLELVSKTFDLPVVYPIHPRSQKMMNDFGFNSHRIIFIEPQDSMSFLQLEKNAALILTDSGGVQEEACILHVPCVTLRRNTERPETVDVGANLLVGYDANDILKGAEKMIDTPRCWENPFGDGTAAQNIVNIIINNLP